MITQKKVDEAFDWLWESIEPMAEAKAKLEFLDDQTKSVLAFHFCDSDEKTQKGKEMSALCEEDYLRHLNDVKKARKTYETYRLRRDYYTALLDSWRTQQATNRIITEKFR